MEIISNGTIARILVFFLARPTPAGGAPSARISRRALIWENNGESGVLIDRYRERDMRVLLADDHKLVRDALAFYCSRLADDVEVLQADTCD